MFQASSGSSATESAGWSIRMPATPEIEVPDGVIAPNGQAREHILQLTQRCSFSATRPPAIEIAATGQTRRQGASSQ